MRPLFTAADYLTLERTAQELAELANRLITAAQAHDESAAGRIISEIPSAGAAAIIAWWEPGRTQ